MKAMIIQPMAGKTAPEIIYTRTKAIEQLAALGYELENTLFDNLEVRSTVKNIPLFYLANSILVMSRCDAVYLCDGWENARGCKIEHAAATAYGLTTIYEQSGDQA